MSEAPSLQDERDIDPELEEALTLRDLLYEARKRLQRRFDNYRASRVENEEVTDG